MERKQRLRILPLLLAVAMLLSIFPMQTQAAVKKSGNGIAGNGTWGIKIDIYSSPFTDYANPNYKYAGGAADNAYSWEGCAWFAASRVKQITGKDCFISGGPNWYNERYSWYGFARGQKMPTGKALACYGNHVSVIEAVQDGQYLVSEGGFSGGGQYVENDYCVIHLKTADQIKNANGCGDFIGFVYLTDDAPVFRTDKKPELPTLKITADGIQLTLTKFNLATGYRIYRKENPSDPWTLIKKTKKTTYTDTTVESGKLYYYTVRAYCVEDGVKLKSKYDKNGVSRAYLAPPSTVNATAYDGKNVVSFSTVTGAKTYLVYRKEAGGSFQKIAVLKANTLKLTDTAVTSGVAYVYKVRAYAKIAGKKVYGTGTESAEVLSYKTPNAPKMTAVYETVSSETGALSASLWFRGNGSDDYTVYRRVKGSAKWKKVKTVANSAFTRKSGSRTYYQVQDNTVKKGKTYEYTVGCHKTIGTHELNSTYGKAKALLYTAGQPLYSLLSDFRLYGNPANSKTRVYRYQNRKNNQRLLKALYTDPSVYNVSKIKGARTVVTGGKPDPYGKFTGESYVKVKEKTLQWAAKRIFHCQDSSISNFRSSYLNNHTAGKSYISGAYLYAKQSSRQIANTALRIRSVQKRNGYYYVKYNIVNADGSGSIKDTQCAVLKHSRYKGKLYWTLYTHNTGRFLAP